MEPLYVGIDLHKKFAYWIAVNGKREVVFEGKVPADRKATEAAVLKLPDSSSVQAVVEPVEHWGWYTDLLESLGIETKLADSLKVGLIAKNRLKHDKVDATALSELLRSGFLPEAYRAPKEIRDLRELLRWRICLVRTRARFKNRAHGVLAKQGLKTPWTDIFGTAGRRWIAALSLSSPYQEELDSLVSLYEVLGREVKTLDKEIRTRAVASPELLLLQTIPPIGPFTALLMKAEVGDFARFPSPGKLAAYAGLVSSSYSSGGKLRFGHITRAGSGYLRWIMVEAAQRVRPKDGHLYAFYRKIREKKGNATARVALARKLLCLAWTIVTKGEPYSEAKAAFRGDLGVQLAHRR